MTACARCGHAEAPRRWEGEPVCVECHKSEMRIATMRAIPKILAEPAVIEALREIARDARRGCAT